MRDGKTTILGCRVTKAESKQMESAADGQNKKLARWLRDGAILMSKVCEECGFTRTLIPGVQDGGCPNCAMGEVEIPPSWAPNLEPMDEFTCGRCGQRYSVRRPVVDAKTGATGPAEDPGCPVRTCRQPRPKPDVSLDLNQTHETLSVSMREFADRYLPKPPRTWAQEWTAMEAMEPGEAVARFNELRAGRKLPAGFKEMTKHERIAWLEREMPL